MKHPNWVVRPQTPVEIYTDRQEFLDYFHHAALEAGHRRTMSTVLLGQRRMGKTEIFIRVVNRLFFEQEPTDAHAVVPVYYSFPDIVTDAQSFAVDYIENFMRYYVGFYTRQPEFVIDELRGEQLLARIEDSRKLYPFRRTLDLLLTHYGSVVKGGNLPEKVAVWLPRMISDIDETTTVMFLDEFQNTRLHNFDVVGWMQRAVESNTCPHFVTGSAMSILAREIIGRGSLFGRFRGKEIEPLTNYYGTELALKVARYYQIELPELMASVVAERCGGNPFYIPAVIHQSTELNKAITSEGILNEMMAVDISSGFIWGELNDQVSRWIERINEFGITKWILYLSALDENEYIDLAQIQHELWERDRNDVSLEKIRDVLIKLSRGDLLEFLEFGNKFRKVDDPILLEFLKVWGRIEVEGKDRRKVRNELERKYVKFKRRVDEYKGYLAEVFMSQVLWNGQNKTLSGRFFHSDEDVEMPHHFVFVWHRRRIASGENKEVDLLGAAGAEVWVCQSKWWVDKVGRPELEQLVSQGEIVREEMDPLVLRLWMFAHTGLSKPARDYAKEHGIFWSTVTELNELLVHVSLRQLPDFEE